MALSEMNYIEGGGTSITKGTAQQISTTINSATISGLDTTKWYAVFGYQYNSYSGWHGVWSEADLKAINGVEDAMLLGSYDASNGYCVAAFLFKPSATSITANLGYRVDYYTID